MRLGVGLPAGTLDAGTSLLPPASAPPPLVTSDAALDGVCAQENSYEQNLRVFQEEMGLSEEEQRWILSRTPLKLWFGGPRQIAPAL